MAPELANGRCNGSPSVPYPPEMARRVLHASKAAAPCPAASRPYQIMRLRGVSKDSVVAGCTGTLAIGLAAGKALPAAGFNSSVMAATTFGEGPSGFALLPSALASEEESIAVAAEADVAGSASAGSAVQQNSNRLERITGTPRLSQEEKGSVGCNCMYLTVPEYRCHWSFGHVFGSTTRLTQAA